MEMEKIVSNRVLAAIAGCIIFLLLPALAPAEQVVIDSDDQFRFARQYMDTGQYDRAVGEYERLIYFFPESEYVPIARYLIGVCYLMAQKYDSAKKTLMDVYGTYGDKPVAGRALFLIGESCYRQGLTEEAEHYFTEVVRKYPNSELEDASLYRLGWSSMKRGKWSDASETFMMVEEDSYFHINSRHLSDESLRGEQLPRKDPTAAGILAAAVPGMGHVYCDRPKDGIVAFLLNGAFIWAACESFNDDNDVLGGIITLLEMGWYSGNIYSAVNSAHKYNRKVRDDFLQRLDDKLNLHLFTAEGVPLGLGIEFDF